MQKSPDWTFIFAGEMGTSGFIRPKQVRLGGVDLIQPPSLNNGRLLAANLVSPNRVTGGPWKPLVITEAVFWLGGPMNVARDVTVSGDLH